MTDVLRSVVYYPGVIRSLGEVLVLAGREMHGAFVAMAVMSGFRGTVVTARCAKESARILDGRRGHLSCNLVRGHQVQANGPLIRSSVDASNAGFFDVVARPSITSRGRKQDEV